MINAAFDGQHNITLLQNMIPNEQPGKQMIDNFMNSAMKDQTISKGDEEEEGAEELNAPGGEMEAAGENRVCPSGTVISLSPSEQIAIIPDEVIKEATTVSAAEVQKP